MEWRIVSHETLCHHGIKGQKWGVRRYQNKDGSYTAAGRRRRDSHNSAAQDNDDGLTRDKRKVLTARNVAIGAAAVGVTIAVLGGMYVYKKKRIPIHDQVLSFGEKISLDNLSTNETVLPKGTKFHRISSKSLESYAEDGRRAYVSYLNKDNRLYKETMPSFIKQWSKTGVISGDGDKVYEHVLRTNKDVKIPSKRTIGEIYLKVTGETEIDNGRYKTFMTNLVDRDSDQAKRFFDLVKERGYNAIIDENDAGSFSKSPLILLDPKNDIESDKSHRVRAIERVINVLLM